MCVIVHTCNQISSEAKARLLPLVQGQFGQQGKIQLHKTKTTKSNDEVFFFSFVCLCVFFITSAGLELAADFLSLPPKS